MPPGGTMRLMERFNNGGVNPTVMLMAALASSIPVSLIAAGLSPGDLIVADIDRDAIFRVDPITGDRTVLTGMGVGSGPSLLQVRGVAIDRWGQIYVTDADSTRRRVVRIDPISGSRTLISGIDRGTGPNLVAPFALAFDSAGELYLSDISTGLDAIFHIDIRTGDRTIVSSSAMGTGPIFGNPTTLAFDASDLLLVGDQVLDGVFSVDVSNGNRTIVSSQERGIGPPLATPLGMGIAADGMIYVATISGGLTSSSSSVVEVNPATGNRLTVSSSSVGSGPEFAGIRGLTLDAAQHLFVVDVELDAVLRVDRISGNRTVISDGAIGAGTTFDLPDPIAVVGMLQLAGDYNGNHVVDAADYVVWRDRLGTTAALPGDVTPGLVSEDDYVVWRMNFGRSVSGGAAAAVPEPGTVLWAAGLLVAFLSQRPTSRRRRSVRVQWTR
jgi:DNA-binding beta-propeller fold protein YncE